jgi:hypothetical protein
MCTADVEIELFSLLGCVAAQQGQAAQDSPVGKAFAGPKAGGVLLDAEPLIGGARDSDGNHAMRPG